MENIYQESIRAVEEGARFNVDFRSRTLKLAGRYIIREGCYEGSLGLERCNETEFLTQVETLYHRYKYSVPSERSMGKSHVYFRALPDEELEDDAMMFSERRDKAQIELELYILCQILLGWRWNPQTLGSWFWQSKKEKDLVILRSWIEPIDNQSLN